MAMAMAWPLLHHLHRPALALALKKPRPRCASNPPLTNVAGRKSPSNPLALAAWAFFSGPAGAAIAASAASPDADLSGTPAAIVASALSPVLACFNLLFLARVVMSWYRNLIDVNKLPFVIAYAPTEPVLAPTRRIIPPLGGVNMSPVPWLALISLANELLLGPQGLLILLARQQV